MDEKDYIVYIHINRNTHKTYIGMTKQKPEYRWNYGKGYMKNVNFFNEILKYGWDNFDHIILFKNKTQKEAEELERLFIKILLSNNDEFGYNTDNGGITGEVRSEKTKQKISEIVKNREISEETRQKLREYMLNLPSELHPSNKKVYCNDKIFNTVKECAEFYDVKPTTMSSWLRGIEYMPQNFVKMGLMFLEGEYKIKESKTQMEYKPKYKKVICDGIIYNSITECSKYYGIHKSNMSNWLKGKHKMPKQFIELGLMYCEED